jgi:hypothetical protein
MLKHYGDSKYLKWYNSIIENAVTRNYKKGKTDLYLEIHHIVPKSLGGNNSKQNLVSLTAREHLLCHLLLVKITKDKRMIFALNRMIYTVNEHHQRITNSKMYEVARKIWANYRTGQKMSEETKNKLRVIRAKQIMPDDMYERTSKIMSSLTWMNDGVKSYRVRPENVEASKQKGYKDGRLSNYITDEYRNKFKGYATEQWRQVKQTGHNGHLIKVN